MRPRPCSPGGYERRSMAHFSVRQRSPFRKSFMPSRRHCLHFGERSRATNGHLSSESCLPAAKRASRKDAGGVRSGTLRERPGTRRDGALQGPGEREAGGRWPLSNTPPFLLTDAVVCLWRDVLHAENLQARCLQRADRRLATRARALDEHFDLLQAVLHALARRRVGGHLRGERRRLAGALEPG